MTAPIHELIASLDDVVIGRRREVELVVAALDADRHVLLEGPPGTGKSTLLRAVAGGLGIGFVFVEGNAELTPARLVGHFDPARVLTARYGRVAANPGFRLVAAMNPFDAVGTARISGAVYDRVCRVSVGYQSADVETRIASRGVDGLPAGWLDKVVELVRRTRAHSDLRVGSSVRGAIDMTAVASSLASVRATTVNDPVVSLDAALVALSGRVRVREGSSRTSEDIITELWNEVFNPAPVGESGKANAPAGATR
ncbi:MAG: MoxR family ATPase [Actinobacteria bacterium]|nr:MoxR family ATPase [Actinomycetota bacterium]